MTVAGAEAQASQYVTKLQPEAQRLGVSLGKPRFYDDVSRFPSCADSVPARPSLRVVDVSSAKRDRHANP